MHHKIVAKSEANRANTRLDAQDYFDRLRRLRMYAKRHTIPGSMSVAGDIFTSNRRFRPFLRTSIHRTRSGVDDAFFAVAGSDAGVAIGVSSVMRNEDCGWREESSPRLAARHQDRDGCQSDAFCPSLPAPGGPHR